MSDPNPAPVAEMFATLASMPPIERLTALHHIEPAVKAAMEATVAELRADGSAWSEIGAVLGVTRQAVQIRFGRGRTDP